MWGIMNVTKGEKMLRFLKKVRSKVTEEIKWLWWERSEYIACAVFGLAVYAIAAPVDHSKHALKVLTPATVKVNMAVEVGPLTVPVRELATGYMIKIKGKLHVVTNQHVCGGWKLFIVTGNDFKQNQLVSAYTRVAKVSKKADLCILKVLDKRDSKRPFQTLEIADREPVYDEEVFSMGYPFASEPIFRRGRVLVDLQKEAHRLQLLRMFVRGGQSGSPVVDTSGKVICTINSRSMAATEAGFCVKNSHLIELIKEVADEMR